MYFLGISFFNHLPWGIFYRLCWGLFLGWRRRMDAVYPSILFVYVFFLIGKLSSLILRNITDQWWLICYFGYAGSRAGGAVAHGHGFVCVCVWFPYFDFVCVRLHIFCLFMCMVNICTLYFSFSTFCSAWFGDRYCLNLNFIMAYLIFQVLKLSIIKKVK